MNEIIINENLKSTLEWLKECSENNYIFETGNSKEIYEYIIKLQNEIKELEEYAKNLEDCY